MNFDGNCLELCEPGTTRTHGGWSYSCYMVGTHFPRFVTYCCFYWVQACGEPETGRNGLGTEETAATVLDPFDEGIYANPTAAELKRLFAYMREHDIPLRDPVLHQLYVLDSDAEQEALDQVKISEVLEALDGVESKSERHRRAVWRKSRGERWDSHWELFQKRQQLAEELSRERAGQ